MIAPYNGMMNYYIPCIKYDSLSTIPKTNSTYVKGKIYSLYVSRILSMQNWA